MAETLEDLQARHAAELAEATKVTPPILTAEEAAAQLAAAETALASIEGPGWALKHAEIDVQSAQRALDTASEALKAPAQTALDQATAALTKARAANASPPTAAQIDAAAQAVLDAREAVERAKGLQPKEAPQAQEQEAAADEA